MPIATLFDDKNEDGDEEKKGTELYTGGDRPGGGGSGLAVMGPDDGDGDGGDDDDHVTRMFRQAQANAAAGYVPPTPPSRARARPPRRGERNRRPRARRAPASGDGAKTTVAVYANGFTVDGGPFRPADGDAANAAFLADVARGVVPRELEESVGGGALDLQLVDKRGETYEPPAYVAFSGGGQTLASAAPAAGAVLGGAGAAVAEKPVVDDASPKTTLQIRLADGKRIKVVLNLTHTVAHLDAFVRAEGAAAASYVLLAGYPPAPLSDPSATIDAAGLKGASVTQKLT